MGIPRSQLVAAAGEEAVAAAEKRMSPIGDTPKPKAKKKRRGVMNGLERSFAETVLEPKRIARVIQSYQFEAVKFRLADGCWYTADFFVDAGGGEFVVYETKGSWRAKNQRDGRTRLKVAAEQFPMFDFFAVTRVDGQWRYEQIGGKG